MTTHKKTSKLNSFWEEVFNPKGGALIEVNAHLLAGQYLKQIEEVLDSENIPQKDLAQKINISPSYLSQLFCGNKLPSWKTLAKIELALNIKFSLKQHSSDNVQNLQKIFLNYTEKLNNLENSKIASALEFRLGEFSLQEQPANKGDIQKSA